MKKLLVLFVLIPALCFSQKKSKQGGYGSLTLLAGFYKDGKSIGGSINAGGLVNKVNGLGFGFDVVKFEGVQKIYLPLYGDIRFYIPSQKNWIYLAMQPGYGIYNNVASSSTTVRSGSTATIVRSNVEQQGGFYFSTGIGFSPKSAGKLAPCISLRFASYRFNTKYSGTGITSSSSSGTIDSGVLNFGLSF